jgi:hypothetical protein
MVAAAVMSVPAAAADQDEYLRPLQDRYVYLTAQQLLSEGNRVCAATQRGALSADITTMVRNDLGVSTATAGEIVAAAVVRLC